MPARRPGLLESARFTVSALGLSFFLTVCGGVGNISIRVRNDAFGWVAQLVEQRIENPRVAGSSPAPTTIKIAGQPIIWLACFFVA